MFRSSREQRRAVERVARASGSTYGSFLGYVERNPSLQALMIRASAKDFEIKAAPSVKVALKACLRRIAAYEQLAELQARHKDAIPRIPGHLASFMVRGDNIMRGHVLPLSIYGNDTSDGGAGVLTELNRLSKDAMLEQLNEAGAEIVSVWCMGMFGNGEPVHLLALDAADTISPFIVVEESIAFVGMHFFKESLRLQEQKFMRPSIEEVLANALFRKGPGFDSGYVQTPESYMDAQAQGYLEALLIALLSHTGAINALHDFRDEAQQELREKLDEARRGRQAAVEVVRTRARKDLELERARAAKLQQRALAAEARARVLEAQLRQGSVSVPVPETPAAPPSPSVSDTECGSQESVDHYRELAEHQAAVLRELRVALRHSSAAEDAASPSEDQRLPRTFADLDDWAAENADRVIVMGRALREAKKASYEDASLVFRALDLLAGTYRDVKLGVQQHSAWTAGLSALGLEVGTLTTTAKGEGDAYVVSWGGRRLVLDQHLRKGNSRDPRYCLRIYYTWHDEECKVVIGWLPSHLPIPIT